MVYRPHVFCFRSALIGARSRVFLTELLSTDVCACCTCIYVDFFWNTSSHQLTTLSPEFAKLLLAMAAHFSLLATSDSLEQNCETGRLRLSNIVETTSLR